MGGGTDSPRTKETHMSYQSDEAANARLWLKIIFTMVFLVILVITGSLVGCPNYNVYTARKSGEAILAEAQSSRLAKVAEAKARFESAQFDAQAEVVRAKGTKDANNIVISSFGSTEERLDYLRIQAMHDGMQKGTVIYVPTNNLIPTISMNK
jgi:multidrug efflux pump subunit AcrA (membrane-fusion protein)